MSFKDTFFSKNNSLNCRGKLLDLSQPRIMGILNITPDSFYDGGRYLSDNEIITQAERMLDEGADILDIGGISTRPGAKILNEKEEIDRLRPVLRLIRTKFPDAILSVDTFRSAIARFAVTEYGVDMINDISGGEMDRDMFQELAGLQVPYIIMHMRGDPETMQSLTDYDDLVGEMTAYFSEKVKQLTELGIKDIVIDPGFGFSKTIDQNYFLLKHLHHFQIFELPVMAGVSRKSMIYKTLEATPDDALNGTTVLHTIALLQGANLLRVHDVKEAIEAISLVEKYQQAM
ncbi:MAG: dihydropteroate synthase [Bacteroidales bacterium]|nr:dihydropteroate synthase [Bacteroidales bacterium]